MEQVKEKKDRLPILRERLNDLLGDMSITDFAQKVGISRQTMGFYLNGDRIPDAATLQQICATCNVSADWLLGLTSDPSRSPCAVDDLGLSMKAVQLLKAMGILNNANDFLSGLSMILEDSDMLFISSETQKLKERIQSEMAHTKQFLNTLPENTNHSFQTDAAILMQDEVFCDSLIKELEISHPELNNRMLTVTCGATAVDMAIHTITERFTAIIHRATGYYELLSIK